MPCLSLFFIFSPISSFMFVHREGSHINVYGGLSKTHQKMVKCTISLEKYLVLLIEVEYT